MHSGHFTRIRGNNIDFSTDLDEARHLFAREWDSLGRDNSLARLPGVHRRHYSQFSYSHSTDEIVPVASAGQSISTPSNANAADLEHVLPSLSETSCNNRFLHAMIQHDFSCLPEDVTGNSLLWDVGVHQLRTHASDCMNALPSMDDFGVGHSAVCYHLINRDNVYGGVSRLCREKASPLFDWTMNTPLDSIILWDSRLRHAETPLKPKNRLRASFRDMLIITFSPTPG